MAKRKKEVVEEKGCCANWDERVKRFGYCELGYVKFASMAFILFLITAWVWMKDVLLSVHWAWYLALMLLFSIKPAAKFFRKK